MKPILLIILFIASTCGQIMSQDSAIEQHFKLVKQYNSIDDVYIKHPELKPKPKRIVINENEILFYNEDKSIAKTIVRKQDFDIDTSVSFYGQEKINGIRKRFNYRVIDDKLLTMVSGLSSTSGATHQVKPLTKKVFNRSGNFITNINPLHYVVVSDDSKFFVSYYEGEGSGDTLVLYNETGDKLCQHYATSDASVRFLPKRNLLGIKDNINMTLTILNSDCEKKIELYFMRELNIGYVGSYFYSTISNQVLLSTFSTIVLFDTNNGEIWNINENFVQDCIFLEGKDELLLKVWNNKSKEKNNQYQVKLINISNGDTIESLHADEILFMNTFYFIIRKGDKCYEYAVN